MVPVKSIQYAMAPAAVLVKSGAGCEGRRYADLCADDCERGLNPDGRGARLVVRSVGGDRKEGAGVDVARGWDGCNRGGM